MFDEAAIQRARDETPACRQVIHFDNAGASLMPAPVTRSLYGYLGTEEKYGGYRTSAMLAGQLDDFYTATAALLNCDRDEVAFTENATRAWDMVFYAFRFEPGDKILTTIEEYGSNVIAYLQQAKRYGVEIVFVPSDEHGAIDTEALRNLIDDRVRLISISHIPTGGGLVNPAAEVGRLAKAAGIPYLLDACQSIGQIPMDMKAIGCDMACGTGRKYLRGPRGTGLLYVSRDWIQQLEPPLLDQQAAELLSSSEYRMRDDARRFESWEQNYAGKAALGTAINYANQWGMDNIQQRVYYLAKILRNELNSRDGFLVADQGKERCGIVTFAMDGHDPFAIKEALAKHDTHVSISIGSGNLVSYQHRGIHSLVRASLHYFNTEREIEQFVGQLQNIQKND